MNISRVNPNCAFKGYLKMDVYKYDENDKKVFETKNICTADIRKIKDGHEKCVICCSDKNGKEIEYYKPNYSGYSKYTNTFHYVDINTILSAYNAVKDNDLVVEL